MTEKTWMSIFYGFVMTFVLNTTAHGVSPEDVLFYASFNGSVIADRAVGNKKPINQVPAGSIAYEPGISRNGLGAKKPYSVRYEAKSNIQREKGAISFWWYIEELDLSIDTKESYQMFNIDAGNQGYISLHRPAQQGWVGPKAGLTSRDGKAHSSRLLISMPEAGKWHFIVVNWNVSKGNTASVPDMSEVDIYVNGVLAGRSAAFAFPKGWRALGFDLGHEGRRLDEVTVYRRPLLREEVKDLYHRTASMHLSQLASISKTDGAITIDGNVSDEEWGRHTVLYGLHEITTGYLDKPDSRIGLCYDEKNLYVAFETAIPEEVIKDLPNKILEGILKQTAYKHDVVDVERDDAVSVHIIPKRTKRDWYRMVVNGLNTHYEYSVRDRHVNLSWDPKWKTASTADLNGWHVEMAIPLEAITAVSPRVGTIWGMNFLRYWRKLKNGVQVWSWGDRSGDTRNKIFSKFHATDPSKGTYGEIRFAGDENVNVQIMSIGKPNQGVIGFKAKLINTFKDEGKKVRVYLRTETKEVDEDVSYTLEPGQEKIYEFSARVNDSGVLKFLVRDADSEAVYYCSESPFLTKRSLDIWMGYYPGYDRLNISLNATAFRRVPLGRLKAVVDIKARGGSEPLLSKDIDKFDSYAQTTVVETAALKPANYDVVITLKTDDGRVLRTAEEHFEKRPLPPWYGNTIGISDKVPSPFEPLRLDRNKGTISCWGRQYVMPGLFPTQVITQGDPILAEGIRLRLTDMAGNEYSSRNSKCGAQWTKVSDTRIEYERSMQLGPFEVSVEGWLEYDGFMWNKLKVKPRNRSRGVKHLYLDIPYRTEWAELINTADYGTGTMGKVNPKGWNCAGKRPLWLGNGIGGMQWVTETTARYRLKDKRRAVRVIPGDKKTVMRVTFIDVPTDLSAPFETEFGLVATPTRPRTPDYRRLNSLENVVKVQFGEWGLYTYIPDPSRIRSNEKLWIPYKVGYQRDPMFPKPALAKHSWVSRAPYSTTYCMSPETDEFRYWGAEWACSDRFVYIPDKAVPVKERGTTVCQSVKSWQDFYVWSYWKLYQKQRFRGIYHDDGIAICTNTGHGHGYSKDGVVEPRTTVLGKREINKRLYTMLREAESKRIDEGYPELQGRTYIIQHHSGYLDMAWASFCDYYADGENFTGQLTAKDIGYHRVYPPDRFRAQSMGHNFGPVCWFADEFHRAVLRGADGSWLYKTDGSGWENFEPVLHLFGLILLHDSTYWMSWAPSDSYLPYVIALRYCKWGDQYRMIPYWSQKVVKLADKQYATFYVDDKAKRVIMVFLNNNERGGTFNRTLDWKRLGFGSWKNLKLKNVHPVPTCKVDGKLKVRLDEWEKRWKTKPNAWIERGKLRFTYGRACSRLIVIEQNISEKNETTEN